MSNCDVYVGIDNGSTGTIGVYVPSKEKALVVRTPLLEHDVGGKWRLDFDQLTAKLFIWLKSIGCDLLGRERMLQANVKVAIEPPMLNAKRWHSTIINVRLDEAFLQYCEAHGFPWRYMRPVEWQEVLGDKEQAADWLLRSIDTKVGDRVDEEDIDGLAIAYVLAQHPTKEQPHEEYALPLIAGKTGPDPVDPDVPRERHRKVRRRASQAGGAKKSRRRKA